MAKTRTTTFSVPRSRSKKLPMHPVVREAIEQQFEAFRQKFGREPGPGDPVFFDPDADQPEPLSALKMEEEMVRAATAAGVEPAIIFAYSKTGMFVTEHNVDQWSAEDLEEWDAAIEEGRRAAATRS